MKTQILFNRGVDLPWVIFFTKRPLIGLFQAIQGRHLWQFSIRFMAENPKHGPSTPLDCYFGRCFRLFYLFLNGVNNCTQSSWKVPYLGAILWKAGELERLYCQGMASGGREFNGEHFAEFRALILPLNGWPVWGNKSAPWVWVD